MTIEINEKSYIVGFWFSSCPKTYNDWLACAIKDPDREGHFKAWSRFRYVKDKESEPFNGSDDKSWTTLFSKKNDTE